MGKEPVTLTSAAGSLSIPMLDLSHPCRGSLGPSSWFSNLFLVALESRFTGGIMIQTSVGARVLFFQNGDPVLARGPGFREHFLGQICVELGLLHSSLVIEARQLQDRLPENERSLLGEILTTKFNLSPSDLSHALNAQCSARFASCFGLKGHLFDAVPGENENLRSLYVKTEGWPILLKGLMEFGSDEELKETTDRVLGRSVKLKGSVGQLDTLMGLSPTDRQRFRYLEKPRKPDQLERSIDRHSARAMLRILELLDLLELHSVGKAIPIPKAIRNPPTSRSVEPISSLSTNRTNTSDVGPDTSPRRPKSGPITQDIPKIEFEALVAELNRFHTELNNMDHFQVLNLDPAAPQADVRRRFAELAKKYHPDMFTNVQDRPDLEQKVREVSARLNEAYKILSNSTTRAEYEALRAEGRTQGPENQQNLVRDAEVKVKMARVHIKMREYEKARTLLKQAIRNDPQELTYQADYGWTMFADPTFDKNEAFREGLPMIEKAYKAHPTNANIHYYLGRVYKQQGRTEAALKHFSTAAQIDPNYLDAVRETRLLGDRIRKAPKNSTQDMKSALRKFFKF